MEVQGVPELQREDYAGGVWRFRQIFGDLTDITCYSSDNNIYSGMNRPSFQEHEKTWGTKGG
ncbi:hypothetical protein EGD47_25670 [Salmonella enterica]|nr:hypothetical protein [Salmonella enterica]MJL37863.1 hypothetical protein [Salmonella enterica subsp. enterica serovar Minnesota]